jgi:hypothetical protein
MIKVAAPHPATLADEPLLKQCVIGFGRTSGPGGQHRNKVETAVRLEHTPTGVSATATERRKQQENRREAIRRLRIKLAIDTRTRPRLEGYRPTPLWETRRQGRQVSVNPKHRDYPGLLAEALDVVVARNYDVAGAAGILGVSMSQLAKLIRHEKRAMAHVNEQRVERGLPALR